MPTPPPHIFVMNMKKTGISERRSFALAALSSDPEIIRAYMDVIRFKAGQLLQESPPSSTAQVREETLIADVLLCKERMDTLYKYAQWIEETRKAVDGDRTIT